MKATDIPVTYWLAGGAVLAAVWYIKTKGVAGAAGAVASNAVHLVDSVVSETVVTAGEVVGIPRTDKTVCQQKIEAFRAAPWYEQAVLSFGVSANCSTGDYFRFIGTGKGPQDP